MNFSNKHPHCNRVSSYHRLLIAVLSVLCIAFVLPFSAAAVSIETGVDPSDLYEGESVTLTLRISDFADGMEPDLSRIPAANVTLLGQRDESQSSITIINGQRKMIRFSGRLFQYRVTPERTGTFNLGPIGVAADGKTLTSVTGPAVTVRAIPAQDSVLAEIALSKSQVIIDEPFKVTLRIRVRRLSGAYADISPLPQQAPPSLDIPYLSMGDDSGLDHENIQDRLNSILVSDGDAFFINNFTVGNSPFGGLFGQSLQARFRPHRKPVTYNGIPYYEYTLPLEYTPRREGTFHFGPVIFKGQIFTYVTPAGEGRTEKIYAIGEAAEVRVTAPPTEGRPDTYIGAIGTNLVVSAALDAQTCFVGDPLMLTIDIGGNVRLDGITAPRLAGQKTLQRDFKIYEDTVQRESEDNRLRYRFTIRPARAGTFEFPPVAVSYYDSATSAYRTVYTEPIPIRANAVTEVQGDIVINTGNRSITLSANDDDDASRYPPAPVEMTANLKATDRFFMPMLHLPLLLAGPLLALASLLLRLLRRHYPEYRAYRTRRSAAALALRHIRQAGNRPDGQNAADSDSDQAGSRRSRDIAETLRGYLQAQCGDRVRAATPDECRGMLQSAGISHDLADRVTRFQERCAQAAFSHDSVAGDTATETTSDAEAAALITELDTVLKQHRRQTRRRRKTTGIELTLLVLSLALSSVLNAGEPLSEDFESQRAMTVLLTASQPELFADAAGAFAELIDQGAANAGLFYNYGTALLMADEPAAALEALRRAERYSGTTWSIRRNMLLALRALNKEAPVSLPWYRIPLFWHYQLPASARMTVAATAFLILWLLGLLPAKRLREVIIPAKALAAVLFLLFTASVISSVYSEHLAALAHAQRQPAVSGGPTS